MKDKLKLRVNRYGKKLHLYNASENRKTTIKEVALYEGEVQYERMNKCSHDEFTAIVKELRKSIDENIVMKHNLKYCLLHLERYANYDIDEEELAEVESLITDIKKALK